MASLQKEFMLWTCIIPILCVPKYYCYR